MFDVDITEFLIVVLVAIVVIGPKDMPRVLRYVGRWVGKARGVMSQVRSGFDDMVRESELQEMEQKWRAENERIMAAFPSNADTEEGNAAALIEAADAQQGNDAATGSHTGSNKMQPIAAAAPQTEKPKAKQKSAAKSEPKTTAAGKPKSVRKTRARKPAEKPAS
jgi:sec-independent protein translocase protein TatB